MSTSTIEAMFVLQKQLNDATNGENWENGVNKFGKKIDWYRCIVMEACELIDSTPWKHWKNIDAEPDWDNIRIELVDIWHFLMSEMLRHYSIHRCVALTNEVLMHTHTFSFDQRGLLKEIDEMLLISLSVQQAKIEVDHGLPLLLDQFANACQHANLSLEDLTKMYLGKNALNQFRQDNGYKTGSYKKTWNGVEDNVVLLEILNSLTDVSFDTIYKSLNTKYATLDT
jgi:dimeric dUTPase (all-alpha-NTP-PPase superfamily)